MFACLLVCSISGVAAAVKWLTVPGEAHVTRSRAGPSLFSPPVSLSVSPERDEQCPGDEASVQRATKELDLGTLPGRERGRETLESSERERERQTERGRDIWLCELSQRHEVMKLSVQLGIFPQRSGSHGNPGTLTR